jgi:dUTP pyrophosphatase
MNTKKGKFIVFYGINNLGKSTQAKIITDRLNSIGIKTEHLKYPIYELSPSGKLLNSYLREGNPHELSTREAQLLYANNRTQYETKLKEKLNNGINIIAEDYTGTGIAWGVGAGIEESFLKYINSHLLKEDLAFLFDGQRFINAKENNHKHENNDFLTDEVRWAHLKLGQEYAWIKINANQDINEIHGQIWQKVMAIIQPERIKNAETILKINRLHTDAKIPTRGHASDAGLDLYSVENYSIYPDEISTIHTGIKIAVPQGFAGLIWDKSSLARQGLKTMGGVIDCDYRGEIQIIVKNLSDDIINITNGQKIAQMLIQKITYPIISEEIIDNSTTRGVNGFGSTGQF